MSYKIIILVVLILVQYSDSFSQTTLDFNMLVQINSETDSDKIFGWVEGAVTQDGNLFISSNSEPEIRIFDKDGSLLSKMRREGKGPGEMIKISSLYVDENESLIYVYDSINSRITIYDTDGLEFMSEISIRGYSDLSKVYAFDETLLLVGNRSDDTESLNMLHVYNSKGRYQNSTGELIDVDQVMVKRNPVAKNQILQGFFSNSDENRLFATSAPYKIFTIKNGFEPELLVEEDLIPKPWLNHIKVTPYSYEASYYPQIINFKVIDGDHNLVAWVNPETKKSYFDLRNNLDGKLINRFEFDYDEFVFGISLVGQDGLGYIATQLRDDLSLKIYSYTLN